MLFKDKCMCKLFHKPFTKKLDRKRFQKNLIKNDALDEINRCIGFDQKIR